MFTDDDPIVGVDLDDCREPDSGNVDDTALDIIERLDSYTEVSPPGTGFHVLINGDLPAGRNRRGSVELYDTARFFTHETVGAEYRSEHVWGTQRTQFVAADGLGATFQKRHFDARLGWHETPISRAAVREELLTRLTRPSSLASERTYESVSDRSDRFYVTHVDELRRNEEY